MVLEETNSTTEMTTLIAEMTRGDDQDGDVHLQFSIEEEMHVGVRFDEGFNIIVIDPRYDAWLRLNHPEALGPVCVTPSPLSGSSSSDSLPVIQRALVALHSLTFLS